MLDADIPSLAQAELSRLAGDVAKAIEECYNQASASYKASSGQEIGQ